MKLEKNYSFKLRTFWLVVFVISIVLNSSSAFSTNIFESVIALADGSSYGIVITDQAADGVFYAPNHESPWKHLEHLTGKFKKISVMAENKPKYAIEGVTFGNIYEAPPKWAWLTLEDKNIMLYKGYAIPMRKDLAEGGSLMSVDFTYQGMDYLLLSLNSNVSKITYILRLKDGKYVVLDRRYRPIIKHTLSSDGILSVEESDRKVSLSHFDIESKFEPSSIMKVRDGENQEKNPVQEVEQIFGDFRSSSGNIQNPITESDKKILLQIKNAILGSNTVKTAVLLGPAGTAKTTLMRQFAMTLPPTWKVLDVGPSSFGGVAYKGQFESRVNTMLVASKQVPIVWIFDEIHSLRGQGTNKGNSNDIFQMIKKEIAAGEMMILGASTNDEYNEAFSGDQAVMRRFKQIIRGTFSQEDALNYLKSWFQYQRFEVPDIKILERIMELTRVFRGTYEEPARSIQLLEHIYTRMVEKFPDQEKLILTREEVDQAAADLYQIDISVMNRDVFVEKAKALPIRLNRSIVGLETAKSSLLKLTKRALMNSGSGKGKGPALSALIFGPPGTGKTELSKAFAEAIGYPFVRIEMNRYDGQNITGEDLIADIAAAIRRNPFSVIVLDELEKANSRVTNGLLAMFDNDKFSVKEWTDSSKSTKRTVQVSARSTFFVLTTNAGGEWLLSRQNADTPLSPEEVAQVKSILLQQGIPQPFFDRVQAILPAPPAANEEGFKKIIALHMDQKLQEFTNNKGNPIIFSKEARDEFLRQVARRYYNPKGSNRDTVRIVQEVVEDNLAEAYMDVRYKAGETIQITTYPPHPNGIKLGYTFCPKGYIEVPEYLVGRGVTQEKSFCVMKYAASNNGSNVAASKLGEAPWVNIGLEEAERACQANGDRYRLMTNDHWMRIARNIEHNPLNWNEGKGPVGTGAMPRGNSNSDSALAPSGDDDPYFGTGFNNDWTHKRTHVLSNGEVIWDMAGNVWQLTKSGDMLPETYLPEWKEFTSFNTRPGLLQHFNPSELYDSSHNVGAIYLDVKPVPANNRRWSWWLSPSGLSDSFLIYRGGCWNCNKLAGIFAAFVIYNKREDGYPDVLHADKRQDIGFRCVYLYP